MKRHRAHPFVLPLAAALLAGILVTLYVISRSGEKPSFDTRGFPFQIEDVIAARITPKLPFFVADVDRDGNDDLLINEPTRLLWYRLHGSEMSLAGEAAYERKGSTRMVTDANGDGHPDFFVLTRSPEGAVLSCHDWFSPKGPSEPLYTIGPLLLPTWFDNAPWKTINLFGSFFAAKGAHPTIFIGLNTQKSEAICRALLAYDGVTGKRLWRFEFGPHSKELEYGDFGAAAPLVVFTTKSVATGNSCSGMADTASYVSCLDSRDGNLLWTKRVTGIAGGGSLALADINGDGQNEILVARCLGVRDERLLERSSPWTVEALSREGVVLDALSLGIRALSIRVVNLDGGPSPEILVESSEGDLAILKDGFATVRIVRAPSNSGSRNPLIIGVGDLTDDGKPEIICRLDGKLVVRDHNGTPIAFRGFAYDAQAQLARYDGRNYLVAARGDSIHVMILERTPLATRLRAHASRLAIAKLAAAMLIVGVGGFHLRRHFRRRRMKLIMLDEVHNDLLTAMAAFGHGGSSLKVIDRVRLHLKNWERVQADSGARGELIAKLRETLMEMVAPELEHIVMLARKAGVAEEIWGPIGARTESAGREMEAILAEGPGGSAADRSKHIANALKALDDCDELIAGIRSYLRSVFRAPVTEALERGMARFRDEHGDAKISLALPSDAPADAGVFIAPVVFDKILEAIFTNSARATEGRADAEIAIDVRWEGSYCMLDIRDNGCGIPREDWERVFERFFTTKEEGGFGLYYAHEMLAKVNGKIFVLDSVVGSSTTIRVVLRKS